MIAQIIAAVVIATTPIPCEPYTDEVHELYEPIGVYEITAYGYNEGYGENYKTATGAEPEPYKTVAVDPDVIPLGTELYIEGIGWVTAEDTGGAVKGNVIDLHVGYDDCEAWGRQERDVYVRP